MYLVHIRCREVSSLPKNGLNKLYKHVLVFVNGEQKFTLISPLYGGRLGVDKNRKAKVFIVICTAECQTTS